jgi:MOSC domain-containing protein YiiM
LTGQVISIHRASVRDARAEPLASARILTDVGLEGDFRSRRPGRHVTLIEEDTLDAVAEQLGIAIPAGASRRQIVTRGVALNPTVGQRLRVGEVLLEVTSFCDPCVKMEDKIGPGARAALTGRGGVCARVLAGGILRVGDTVVVEPAALVASAR